MHNETWTRTWSLAASIVGLLTACGTVQDPEGDADAALPVDAAPIDDCARRDEPYTDFTGRRWEQVSYCRNDAGAPLYAEPSTAATLVANMDTAYSWFVCYRRGDVHAGSDVWYYTQGDRPAPGGAGRDEWGYMPAVNVRASVHPAAGVPAC